MRSSIEDTYVAYGGREGISVEAEDDGLHIYSWYDTAVYIEGITLTWEKVDSMRQSVMRKMREEITRYKGEKKKLKC